ncbi:hypothetical protein ACFE04_030706 [Oxalis oulophora]
MDYQSENKGTIYPHIILDLCGPTLQVAELVSFYEEIRSCVADKYFMDILRLYSAEFLKKNPLLMQITVSIISKNSNRITLVMHSKNFHIHSVIAGEITYTFNVEKATNPYDNQYLPYATKNGIVHRLNMIPSYSNLKQKATQTHPETKQAKLSDGLALSEFSKAVDVLCVNCNRLVREDPTNGSITEPRKVSAILNSMNWSFVSPWFKSDLYKDLYQNIPFPMIGRDDWPESMEVTLAAPPARLNPGRPQQKRYPEQGENGNGSNATRKGKKRCCQYCFKYGHNKRACPQRIKDEKEKAEQAAKEQA